MSAQVDEIVMPGDIVEAAQILAKEKKVILGPGIRKQDDHVTVCKAGILRMKLPNTFWVDNCYQKRYIPCRGDLVIGTVVQKSGDIFRVDIGASDTACLSYLAFENATKKNRPDVNVGDLLYAKLLIANKDFESELVCVNSMGKKEKLGVLSDGFTFSCSINLTRKILSPNVPLLKAVQKEIQVPAEIVIGMNGRVWIKGRNVKDVMAISNAILAAEYISDEDIGQMCNTVGMFLSGIK